MKNALAQGQAYRPQDHAAALTHWTELLVHQSRQIAELRGDVARLLHGQAKSLDNDADPGFDGLVSAAFEALRSTTWVTAELFAYTLRDTSLAMRLAQAVSTVGKTSPRALGKYLAARVSGESYITSDGLEIRRSGVTGGVLAWTIVQV